MRAKVTSGIAVAGMLMFGASALAQSGTADPSSSQSQAGASTSAQQTITVSGCVQPEADYRKAHDAGRGGAAGSGVGVGNEFVLVAASSSAAGSGASGATGTTGTSGSASGAMAYELTGSQEGQAGKYVGKRVEITGKLKAAETAAGGQPTGGATAGAPPAGVDVASKDLKLHELEVTSVRESSGSCPETR